MNLGFTVEAFLDGTNPISYAAALEATYKNDSQALWEEEIKYLLKCVESIPARSNKPVFITLDVFR